MGRIEGRKRREMRGGPVAALYREAGEGNQRKRMDLTRGAGLAVREWKKGGSGPAGGWAARATGPRAGKKGKGRGNRGLGFFSNLFKFIFQTFEVDLFFFKL
jgi:hypothetical protein